ncbi:MAG: protoheme IX farnesyltransferase, partial [Methylibium sp.]|nr:protoheme IX farnesyltransferase [Methylibium sp.]
MSETLATPPAALHTWLSRWRQFSALTKPRVVQLIVFCAVIGMLLAVPGWPSLAAWGVALAATIG